MLSKVDDTTIQQATHEAVHGYPGGAVALAKIAKLNPGTLTNKANPRMPDHELKLSEAIAVQRITGNFGILSAFAAALGFAVVPITGHAGVSDIEVLTAYANFHSGIGKTASLISEAFEDHLITSQEYQGIRSQFFNGASLGIDFLNRMEALVDE
ncbi:MAG: phage regulatory CII family protein [Gammaproteobacteria bacterium]